MKFLILVFTVIGFFSQLMAQTQREVTYKQVGDVTLNMLIYYPENITATDTLPAMIFFFGGGWETGNRSQFQYYAVNYAKKGIITILADYRISSLHGTTPFESLKDAKSAVRYLKQHADELQIDTTRLIASGGSAGGHLAAACFTNETINEDTDPMEFSSKPKVLVLFNPVVDNSATGYGYDRLGHRWEEFSPLHNVRSPFPPTIFFLGTNDNLIPVSTGQEFKQKIEQVGGRCDLKLYQGVGHGFFNLTENRDRVILDVDTFLRSVGCLQVSTDAEASEEYWIDINFTRDSTLWKTALPPLAVSGLNYQSSLNGTYLGYNCAGAFGKFAVTGYAYTPFNADDLNEQFIYAFRLSTGASSQWTFPVVPNAGTIKMHLLCGNATAAGEFTLQKNTSGEETAWEDFDPVIKITAPAHNFSTKSFVVEHDLNLDVATMLRLRGPATRNTHIYAITISKKKATKLFVGEIDELQLNLTGRRLRILNDADYSADIYNMTGLRVGRIKSGEQFTFSQAGHYLVQINLAGKSIIKKIAVI